MSCLRKYGVDRFLKRPDGEIGVLGPPLRVAMIDEDRRTPGSTARLDIPPTVSNHEALRQRQAVLCRSLDEKSRCRFAARTAVAVIMRAGPDIVDRKFL